MKKFMEVKVMGYREAVDYVCIHKDNPKHKKYAIISIKNPNHASTLKFQKEGNCLAVLNLEFSDVTPAIRITDTRLMTMEDAWRIHVFVEKIPKQTETLVIHCEQGRSRSAAVAAALLLVKTGSNEQIFGNTYYMPNMYVYYNLLETYGEQNNYWEECYEKEKKTLSKILLSEEQRKFMKLYEQFTKG